MKSRKRNSLSQQLVAVPLSPNNKEKPMKNMFLLLGLPAAGILPFTPSKSHSQSRFTIIEILFVACLTASRLNAQTAVVLDTVFTPAGYDQGTLYAYVYIPNAPNGVGVVLAAGTGTDRSYLSVWCDALAAQGYTAMAINYWDFHSPSFGFYGYAARTFKVAVQFLRRNAARFKITTGKVVGLGQSEGSMHWGECLIWDNDYSYFKTDPAISDHLNAAVLLYGMYDVTYEAMDSETNKAMITYFSKNPSLRGSKGNCLANVGNITTPLLLFHGSADQTVAVQHSMELRDGLVALKKPCQLVVGPWGHGFDQTAAGAFTPAGMDARDVALTFLKNTVLTTGAPSAPVSEISSKFSLAQNYPNPFNPSTTISYSLPKAAIASLRVFNALGQEVASLVNERKEAGYHQASWYANVPSGIYFYRLQAGEFVETKKMILLR
jgi:dienelactone hydrolase